MLDREPRRPRAIGRKPFLKAITSNPSLCTGCRACEMACSFAHTDTFSPDLSRIRIAKDEHRGHDVPVVCRMCRQPACVAACPEAALARSPSGTILLNANLCIGCYLCVDACPHAAVTVHPTGGTPLICDLCSGDPACVPRCATGALRFEDASRAQARRRHRTALPGSGDGSGDGI